MTARIEPLRPEHAQALGRLFEALAGNDDERFFHPHPLTKAEAERRAAYVGEDLYVAIVENGEVQGYGMLRGWDEGYDVPSLGIAIRPDRRGSGLARRLMRHLHEAAWARGAQRIRLTVAVDNAPAHRLFESLGYEFRGSTGTVLVGYLARPVKRP